MALHISLSENAGSRLRERASASGVSPDEYARRLVEQAVRQPDTGGDTDQLSHAEAARRAAALERWFGMHRAWPHVADDSRERDHSDWE